MGMAASQARLLTITARLHDVEYQAQSIQNAKIQLSTQSDQVYQEYLDALDATSLTIKDTQGNMVVANFNNLCSINAVESGMNKYAIKNDRDELVVPDDIKEGYDDFIFERPENKNDPYAFAFYMMNMECIDDLEEGDPTAVRDAETKVAGNHADDSSLTSIQESMDKILEDGDYNDLDDEQKAKYDELEKSFQYKLYKRYASEIYSEATEGEEDFDQTSFDYYVRMFREIQANGGSCASIADYNGPDGDAANDSDWLKDMVGSGKFTIELVNQDKTTGEVEFKTTSVASDTYIGETSTSSVDKQALAKAEAKYENETKKIDAKDKKFDMDLSKLETERTALTTEYDSVKKVINDNIERTFGIFS